MAAPGASASGEDSLIARYFKPLATDPGAFGLSDDAAILKALGEDIVVTTTSSPCALSRAASSPRPNAPGSVASGLK